MKNIKKIMTLIFLFISCSNNTDTVFEYHENGKISKENRIEISGSDTIIYEKQFNENGGLLSESKKVNGKKIGKYCIYYEDKNIQEIGKFLNDSIRLIDLFITENGDSSIINGNGTKKLFFDNGKIFYEGQYRNGQEQGLHKYYQYNGLLNYTEYYLNGLREGLRVNFDANGDTFMTIMYKNDTPIKLQYYTDDTLAIPLEKWK